MKIHRIVVVCAFAIALILTFSRSANAQGGAIIGTVTDNSGAAMAGAKVTVSSPVMMGERSAVTGGNGEYRITPLDPGVYKLVFESSGFGSVVHEGVNIAVGFTATINAEMSPASLAQSVEVTSASPVVDLAASSVTNDVSSNVIENLTAKADYASVLDVTPGVQMTKPDVAGSGAINYQSGPTYGILGEDLGIVEGLSTEEEASAGAPLPYTDEHSFEDMTLTVIGNNAEMPQPGSLTQVVIKSGGNSFHGHVSEIYENEALETTNIDAHQLALGVAGGPGEAAIDTDRLKSFSDFSANMGGYLIKDKLWWFGSYRRESLSQNLPDLIGSPQVSLMPVYTAKVTYNLTPSNKLIGVYQRGIKHQNPGLSPTVIEAITAGQTETWPAGIYAGEWESILSPSLVLQVHGGLFFERGHFVANDQNDLQYMDTGANTLTGSFGNREYTHNRWQLNGNLSYTRTGWHGTHNFKFGSQYINETASNLVTHFDNIEMFLLNGHPSQVTLYLPSTANLTGLRQFGVFAEDSWKVSSRLTLNLGVRFDQYLAYTPSQTAPTGTTFSRINAPTWNNPAPRIGAVYALDKAGKTLVKASYGYFWADPYVYSTVQSQWNPNAPTSSTYTWTPTNPTIVNGLPVFQQGQQGTLLSTTGTNANGTAAVTINPDLKNFYMDQTTAYFEREVAPNFGLRTGFVWNGWRQAYGEVNTNEPFSGFNVPVTVTVPGPDGKLTDSTGTLTAYSFDVTPTPAPHQVIQNLPPNIGNSNCYTWEITATKRMVGRWSLMASFSKTWSHESPYATAGGAPPLFTPTVFNPNTAINTTGGDNDYSNWNGKIMATYNVWKGIKLSPLLRTQSGLPFARTFNATTLSYTSAAVIKAEKDGTERLPTINIFDLRTEKEFAVKERWKIDVFFDLYNLFNSNATQAATTTSGSSFLRPTTITGPRMAGFGAKLDF